MLSKLILCASPNRLIAGRWRFDKCIAHEVFAHDQAGFDAFRLYLHEQAHTPPIYLIADAVEEDYRIETVPHTFGAARQELLSRKLSQLYRNIQYRTAQFVGREQERREDDRFLFMALNNADCITPWVSLIEEQQAPLAGIYLLPMVSQLLLDCLKIKAPDLLLTIRQSNGLRQTYFQNGKLRISRMTPLANLDESKLAEFLLSETEKTRLYLISQRLIGRESRLKLLLVGMSDGISRHLALGPQEFEIVEFGSKELAKRLGLQPAALDQFHELMHMQVLAHRIPPVNLAPAVQTKTYFIHRLRDAINLGSLVVLASGIILSAYHLLQANDLTGQHTLALAQTTKQELLYSEVAKNFPKTTFSGNELKTAVEMAQKLAGNITTPQQLMLVVSTALDVAPEIQLNRLHWILTDDINVKDDEKQVQLTAKAAAPATARIGGNGGLYQIGFVDGEIRNFVGDYRAAMESVMRLVAQLRKNKAVDQVIIVQQPVNTSSLSSLQGSTLDEQGQQLPAALFTLKVVLAQGVHP